MSFATSKEAYIWQLDRFCEACPQIFDHEKWNSMGFVVHSGIRNYFARSAQALFEHSPHLAGYQSNYSLLVNGWYARVNLHNTKKFELLARCAWVAGFIWNTDWDWEPLSQSDPLSNPVERDRVSVSVTRILAPDSAGPGGNVNVMLDAPAERPPVK